MGNRTSRLSMTNPTATVLLPPVWNVRLCFLKRLWKNVPASNLPFWDCMNRIRQNSISIKSISVIMTSRKNSAPIRSRGRNRAISFLPVPKVLSLPAMIPHFWIREKNTPPWSLAEFCAALYGAPAILPNASLAAAGIFPANTVRFSRRSQS